MSAFNGVKVFSATMVADRQVLGEKVTAWIAAHKEFKITEVLVTQSSDNAFHCIAITVFYLDENVPARMVPAKITGSSAPPPRRLRMKDAG